MDLAADSLAGPVPGDYREAGGAAPDLAHCPAFGLGRGRAGQPGARGAEPRHPAAGDRRHGLRLGLAARPDA